MKAKDTNKLHKISNNNRIVRTCVLCAGGRERYSVTNTNSRLQMMIISSVLVLVCLVTATAASPYYDFRLRVREYKTRALETTGCGLWQVRYYLVAL